MRQIGIAFHNYESAKKSMPFGSLYPTAGTTGSTNAGLNNSYYHSSGGFKSNHPSAAHLLFGDATVHFDSENIDYCVYNALGSIAAGESNAQLP